MKIKVLIYTFRFYHFSSPLISSSLLLSIYVFLFCLSSLSPLFISFFTSLFFLHSLPFHSFIHSLPSPTYSSPLSYSYFTSPTLFSPLLLFLHLSYSFSTVLEGSMRSCSSYPREVPSHRSTLPHTPSKSFLKNTYR